MKRRLLIGAAAGACLFPVPAHAGGGAILSSVNVERESAGIAPVTSRSDWSTACADHNDYMATNRILTHSESPGSPLYSASGAWAGRNAVLARDSSGVFDDNPWTTAPLHEFQVLHPWLKQTGVDARRGYACMITLSGRDSGYSSEPRLVTWPGFGQAHRASEVARESPFVPGDEVGLPEGTRTGPHLYVYAVGPSKFPRVFVRSATLATTDGSDAVPLRWVDAGSARSGQYLDGGAILIPVRPLIVGQTYVLRAEVAASTAGGSTTVISRTTSFQAATQNGPAGTDAAPSTRGAAGSVTLPSQITRTGNSVQIGPASRPRLQLSLAWTRQRRTLRVRIRCASASTSRCRGNLRVMVYRRGGKLEKLRFKAGRGPLRISLRGGREIVRRIKVDKGQHHSAKLRGFAGRYGASAPQRLADPKPRRRR